MKIPIKLIDLRFNNDGKLKRNQNLKKQVYAAIAEHQLPVAVILNEKKHIVACVMDKNTFNKEVLLFIKRIRPFEITPEDFKSIKDDWDQDMCMIVDDDKLDVITLYKKGENVQDDSEKEDE